MVPKRIPEVNLQRMQEVRSDQGMGGPYWVLSGRPGSGLYSVIFYATEISRADNVRFRDNSTYYALVDPKKLTVGDRRRVPAEQVLRSNPVHLCRPWKTIYSFHVLD